MQNDNHKKRFAGKGYYIALIACIAAVGISGYVFVKTARDSALETSAAATISPAATAQVSTTPKDPKKAPEASAQPSAAADHMEDSYESTVQDSTVQWPLEGQVLSAFSEDTLTYSQTMADWRTHEGLDIAADQDAPVMAAQSGKVTAVYEDDYLGTVVVISHSEDCSTLYANLSKTPAVVVGDTVSAGDVIGQVGNTALLETAEPEHLHFEVLSQGKQVDPMDFLPDAS